MLAGTRKPSTPTVTAVGTPANGSVSFTGAGQIVYSPSANFNGTDAILYTIDDGNGGTVQKRVPKQTLRNWEAWARAILTTAPSARLPWTLSTPTLVTRSPSPSC